MTWDPHIEAQLRLAAIAATSDDGIIGKDLRGTITSWNRAAKRMFGYTEGEAIRQSIRLIVPVERYPEEDDVLRRIAAGQTVDHYETVRVAKDGRLVDVSLAVSPIMAPSGEVIGASQIARDITESKQLERKASHFAAIVESSDDAIVSKDLDGIVVSWNRAAEELFGFAADEMIGRSIRLIIPADRQGEEDRVLSSIRQGRGVDHFETIRLRKDGTLVPILLTVSPIRSKSGEIIGASKLARDLRRTQRLQRDALRLAAIVDSSDDAIVGKDLNSIVTSWNRAAEAMFGFTADEMIGQSIRLLIPADRQQEEDEVLARIRRGERVEHYETLRQRKDGSLLPVSLTVSPILNDDGVVIGASKIARDVSERQRADEERRRLVNIARDASQLKDEFLATLSHELRTPLNAIVGYLRMMQSGLLSGEKASRAIDTVVRNATSLAQIVEDVLDVSRIVSGKLRLNVQAVELPPLIDEVLDTMRPAAEAKGLSISKIVDSRTAPVSGDPDRLRQVLWNLCSNAMKFTERGGRVQVRLERVNSHVEIAVSDSGVGISAAFLPHLFERFRQADASISRSHGGLGLGLAISRHLVELQGGRIFAESEGPGTGATFRVELPVRSVYASRPAADREHPQAATATGVIVVPRLDGIRILAVDDDRDALSLVREILESTGATVTTADSGKTALDKIARASFDVLVVDLGMPEMNGFDLIEAIRQSSDAHVREIPAAALTAFARSEDRTRAMRSGFQMHLAKPIEPGELMAATAMLARQARVRE
jgi:PAS domain S-box-containing protein